MREETYNKTRTAVKMYLHDAQLLQELYAISAMLDGMERAYYQPAWNKEEFKRKVAIEIQNKINKLAEKVAYRIEQSSIGRPVKKIKT